MRCFSDYTKNEVDVLWGDGRHELKSVIDELVTPLGCVEITAMRLFRFSGGGLSL